MRTGILGRVVFCDFDENTGDIHKEVDVDQDFQTLTQKDNLRLKTLEQEVAELRLSKAQLLEFIDDYEMTEAFEDWEASEKLFHKND